MSDYAAPAHILAEMKARHLPSHPSLTDAYLTERATVLAAFAEAANMKVVPADHPVVGSIVDGVVPNMIILPPPPCLCAHCGAAVPEGQLAAQHVVAGSSLTVTVSHCDGCHKATAECAVSCNPITAGA